MKRLAIIQSSYVPWKGYFAVLGLVDEFVLYDDAHYTKLDWRNRNLIRTDNGTAWLTIPVFSSGRFPQIIRDVEIADRGWASRHWKTIQAQYGRARHFRELEPILRGLYESAAIECRLSRVNELFIRAICDLLQIATKIARSTEYELRGDRTERLVSLCLQTGSREYLSGPKARTYVDERKFLDAGVSVRWMDYSCFAEYNQLHSPPFIHEVTILDLLLNEGIEESRRYMRRALARTASLVFGAMHPTASGHDSEIEERARRDQGV